jgi:hypothetical protein
MGFSDAKVFHVLAVLLGDARVLATSRLLFLIDGLEELDEAKNIKDHGDLPRHVPA